MRPGSISSIALVLTALTFASAAVAAPPPGKKVPFCHRTEGHKGTHLVTIVVGAAAAPAHLRQGDIPGACPIDGGAAGTKAPSSSTAKPAKGQAAKDDSSGSGKSKTGGDATTDSKNRGHQAKTPTVTTPSAPDSASTTPTTGGDASTPVANGHGSDQAPGQGNDQHDDGGGGSGAGNGTGGANGNAGGNGSGGPHKP